MTTIDDLIEDMVNAWSHDRNVTARRLELTARPLRRVSEETARRAVEALIESGGRWFPAVADVVREIRNAEDAQEIAYASSLTRPVPTDDALHAAEVRAGTMPTLDEIDRATADAADVIAGILEDAELRAGAPLSVSDKIAVLQQAFTK